VPSIGVKFDARIPALMQTAGLDALVLDARDEALARRLAERLDRVATERASIGGAVRAAAARQLRRQGEMGLALRREFARHHPGLALPDVAPGWRGGLPALHPDLGRLAAEADGMHASK
jgi:single-stranded DNA-specific DHH superfamily exonuclease